jgi:glycosyltransferase involved in cell wall biosynthesis
MRVLHIYPLFPLSPARSSNGITQSIYALSKELVRRGHQVDVFAADAVDLTKKISSCPEKANIDGINVHYFHSIANFRTFFVTPQIVRSLHARVSDFDLVHIHDLRTFQGPIGGGFARQKRVPYLLQAHGSVPKSERYAYRYLYDGLFGIKLARNASQLVALSVLEGLQYESLGVTPDKIAIVPNGIDTSLYDAKVADGSFKRQLKLNSSTRVFLYLGRLHLIKGLDYLLKAAAILKAKGASNISIVIAGPDEGFGPYLKREMYASSISSFTHLMGPLYGNEKLEALSEADAIVLPSRQELFPIAILEAYAAGKPVIAADIPPLRELVHDHRTGLLFRRGSPESLAEAILEFAGNPAEAARMGREGRMIVDNRYTITRVASRLESLYRECVRRGVDSF